MRVFLRRNWFSPAGEGKHSGRRFRKSEHDAPTFIPDSLFRPDEKNYGLPSTARIVEPPEGYVLIDGQCIAVEEVEEVSRDTPDEDLDEDDGADASFVPSEAPEVSEAPLTSGQKQALEAQEQDDERAKALAHQRELEAERAEKRRVAAAKRKPAAKRGRPRKTAVK